jgi:predicted nucleotidyltransferase
MEDDFVTAIMQQLPMTQAIYLFGSFGTPYQGPASDVDIAVLLPHDSQTPSDQFIALQQQLALMIQRDVDLIDLRSANTILQFEIIEHGRRIADPARSESDLFEVLVCAFYQKIQQERAEIITAGLQSGRFYDRR